MKEKITFKVVVAPQKENLSFFEREICAAKCCCYGCSGDLCGV